MPPKDEDGIKDIDIVIFIDGKPIRKIEEITLPEIELEHHGTIKDRIMGIIADIITVVCNRITNFLLWIQRKER